MDDFDDWIEIKKKVHTLGKIPTINEGEIWWCAMGRNVGVEINGKSERFSRPILILKKLSKLGFLGVPLTSQDKTGSWYVSFEFQNKKQTAALCQIRVISASRLYKNMGMVPETDFNLVKNAFLELYK